MVKEKIIKNSFIVKVRSASLILGTLVLFIILGIKIVPYLGKLGMDIIDKKFEIKETAKDNKIDTTSDWKEFVNEDYRIRIEVPALLLKTKYENENGYLYFMRFEENEYSDKKGVALGVTERSRDEELEYVKNMISKESPMAIPKVKIFELGGYGVTQMDYEAKEDLEARSIIVVNDGNYTFSISTVPEQIERVKSSLMFF